MDALSRLGESLADLEVTNAFIYVGDAVRSDYVPRGFKERGAYVETLSASINSPTSFASLATGSYPFTHGVYSFNERIRDDSTTLFDLDGFDTRFQNSIFRYATEEHGEEHDPIFSVLAEMPNTGSHPLDGLSEPFISMERGPGGHAPYGKYDGTATSYFKSVSDANPTRIHEHYRDSILLDLELFESRLAWLESAGLIDDTLVVYSSDHGELLGEWGFLGHNDPMCPELVHVPTLFFHPDVENSTIEASNFHHVDLVKTICGRLGAKDALTLEGHDLCEGIPGELRPSIWRNQFFSDEIPYFQGELTYKGMWDSSGGIVFTDNSFHERYAVLLGKLIRSSKRGYMLRNLRACARSYSWSQRRFGNPDADVGDVKAEFERLLTSQKSAAETKMTDQALSRLRALGYR